jgi:hypothetical protein
VLHEVGRDGVELVAFCGDLTWVPPPLDHAQALVFSE